MFVEVSFILLFILCDDAISLGDVFARWSILLRDPFKSLNFYPLLFFEHAD